MTAEARLPPEQAFVMTITINRPPRLARIFVLAVFSAAILSCAASPSRLPTKEVPEFSSPFTLDEEGRPVVEVMLGKKGPFRFIFDTASTRTAVSWSVLDKLESPVTPQAPVRILGITGSASAPTATIPSVSLAGESFRDLRIVIIDDWRSRSAQPDGIIGLDILEDYFVVVDPERRVIDFYAAGAGPADVVSFWDRAALTRIPFEENVKEGLSGRIYALEGRVNIAPTPMMVDSGSSASIANRVFLQNVLVLKPTAGKRPVDKAGSDADAIQGISGPSAEVQELIVYGISAGDIRWRDRSIFILDAPIFDDLGFSDAPIALIGFDILSERPFAIDFAGKSLFVKKPR